MSSCFGGRDDQIYLLEFTVERLKLGHDFFCDNFPDDIPVLRLKFLDFPVFEVTRRSQDLIDYKPEDLAQTYDENEGLIYATGKSCLFVRRPRDLVAAMQSKPLRVGLFRAEETFPLAQATVPLSGCLCDQVAMVKNDKDHRPKPYELSGTYNLLDPGKNFAGTVTIILRLTFFGGYVMSTYELYVGSCVFKNEYDSELCVTKINDEDVDENNEPTEFKVPEGIVFASMQSDRATENKEANYVGKTCKLTRL